MPDNENNQDDFIVKRVGQIIDAIHTCSLDTPVKVYYHYEGKHPAMHELQIITAKYDGNIFCIEVEDKENVINSSMV